MQRLILYVDGFNLYHGIHDWSGRRDLWLDVVALGRSLRPRSTVVAAHYFTAPVLGDPGALSRQTTYIEALTAAYPALVRVTMGRYQSKTISCRRCGQTWRSYEEKETDVNIAVRLVADAARAAADGALIVSADSDLVPAVRAARELNRSMFLAAAFPPGRYSAHLAKLMPASFHISKAKIRHAQLPDVIVDPATGRRFQRPRHWR